jgi:hypothetical protein
VKLKRGNQKTVKDWKKLPIKKIIAPLIKLRIRMRMKMKILIAGHQNWDQIIIVALRRLLLQHQNMCHHKRSMYFSRFVLDMVLLYSVCTHVKSTLSELVQ